MSPNTNPGDSGDHTPPSSRSKKPGVDIDSVLYTIYKQFVRQFEGSIHKDLGDAVTRAMKRDIGLYCWRHPDFQQEIDAVQPGYPDPVYRGEAATPLLKAANTINLVRRANFELLQKQRPVITSDEVALQALSRHDTTTTPEETTIPDLVRELNEKIIHAHDPEARNLPSSALLDLLKQYSGPSFATGTDSLGCRVNRATYEMFKSYVAAREGSFYGKLGSAFERALLIDIGLHTWQSFDHYLQLRFDDQMDLPHDIREEWLPEVLGETAIDILLAAMHINEDFGTTESLWNDPEHSADESGSRDFVPGNEMPVDTFHRETDLTPDRDVSDPPSPEEMQRQFAKFKDGVPPEPAVDIGPDHQDFWKVLRSHGFGLSGTPPDGPSDRQETDTEHGNQQPSEGFNDAVHAALLNEIDTKVLARELFDELSEEFMAEHLGKLMEEFVREHYEDATQQSLEATGANEPAGIPDEIK